MKYYILKRHKFKILLLSTKLCFFQSGYTYIFAVNTTLYTTLIVIHNNLATCFDLVRHHQGIIHPL
jgi:hypothetical protein